MEKALLVISFGTSYQDTCEKTIGALEKDLAAAFPDRAFYRAWTSGRILKKLRENGGPVYDDLAGALERIFSRPVRRCVLWFLHTGTQYEISLETQEKSL